MLTSRNVSSQAKGWWYAFVSQVLWGTGLSDLMFVEAIRRCGAIIAVILARLEIPLGVILAHFFLKEKVGLHAYAAGALSLLGVCLISYRPGVAITLESSFYLGASLGILVAIMWALSGIYAKVLLSHQVDPLALSFVRMCIGSVFAFGIAAVFVRHPLQAFQNLAPADLAWIIYLGTFCSAVAFLSFYKSLRIIDAHIVSILLSVSIAVLLVLGLAIGERVSPLQWLGIALVGLSIYLIKKPATAD